MADNVSVPSGSGAVNVIVAADEVTDATLGTVHVQYNKIMDGTLDSTTKLAVKTTSPTTSDGAAVVALSPNSVHISDITVTGTIAASGDVVVLALGGARGASLFIPSSTTLIATLQVKASFDGGTTYSYLCPLDTGNLSTNSTTVSAIAALAVGVAIHVPSGATHIRVFALSYSSGTATINLRANDGGTTVSIGSVILGGGGSTIGSAKIMDAAGSNQGTVKAGNSVPAASDTALVVAVSPNSPRQPDVSTTATLGALSATVTLALAGAHGMSFSIPASTTLNGTIVIHASFDGGTTYVYTCYLDTGSGVALATSLNVLSGNAVGVAIQIPVGATHIQAIVTAYTSGTCTAMLRTNDGGTGVNGTQPPITLAAGSATVGSVQLTDANSHIASIKAASNAPLSTDTSLVVAMSPNSTTFIQGVQGVRTAGTITTAASVVGPITATGYNIFTVTISGTYTGVTAVFEATDDDTNWFQLQAARTDSSIIETGPTLLTTTNRAWDVPIGGMTQFRVRATAYGTGTANIGVTPQTLPYDPAPAAGIANIAGVPISASFIAPVGSYGGQYALNTNPNSQQRATYHFTFRPGTSTLVSGSAARFAAIHHTGASTTTTKIRRVFVVPYANSIAGSYRLELQQFFSGSGGVTITRIGKPDSADPSPQTIGLEAMTQTTSSTGSLAAQTLLLPVLTGSVNYNPLILYDWQECGEAKPPQLRKGVQEGWCFTVTGANLSTIGVEVTMILTEE